MMADEFDEYEHNDDNKGCLGIVNGFVFSLFMLTVIAAAIWFATQKNSPTKAPPEPKLNSILVP